MTDDDTVGSGIGGSVMMVIVGGGLRVLDSEDTENDETLVSVTVTLAIDEPDSDVLGSVMIVIVGEGLRVIDSDTEDETLVSVTITLVSTLVIGDVAIDELGSDTLGSVTGDDESDVITEGSAVGVLVNVIVGLVTVSIEGKRVSDSVPTREVTDLEGLPDVAGEGIVVSVIDASVSGRSDKPGTDVTNGLVGAGVDPTEAAEDMPLGALVASSGVRKDDSSVTSAIAEELAGELAELDPSAEAESMASLDAEAGVG